MPAYRVIVYRRKWPLPRKVYYDLDIEAADDLELMKKVEQLHLKKGVQYKVEVS